MSDAPSPFLQGNWAPVPDEICVTDLPVSGHLPPALNGTYVRNGANPAFEPLGGYHPFLGDGMVHAVVLDGGRARLYRNRWVRTDALAAELAVGRPLYSGATTLAVGDPEQPDGSPFMKNPANTHVIRHGGRILALCEAGPPWELTPDLATVGAHDFGGRLAGAMTAHPKVDPGSGELLFFGYSPLAPYLRYHVADVAGCLVRSEDIDLRAPVMMHDFVCTADHVVFLDAPAVMDLADPSQLISWQPERGARIGVMPRSGGNEDVVWVEVEPCFVFHFMNAWSEGDVVSFDACRMGSLDFGLGASGPGSSAGPPAADPTPRLHRFSVDLAARTARVDQLDDRPADFPRVPDDRAGPPNRYGYAATLERPMAPTDILGFDAIIRYDLEAGTSSVATMSGQVVGEGVFVADPEGQDEQDGWVLTLAWDRATDRSDLVVLDARDLAAGPLARAHLPRRVPYGFHGSWLPASG